MDNFENEINRKIRIRKFAIKNMGNGSFNDDEEFQNEYSQLYQQLNDNIDQAAESKDVLYYHQLCSNRKVIGRITVFIKRVIRKLLKILLGWFIYPIFNKQSVYNGKTINAIKLMNDIINIQERRLKEVEDKYEKQISVNNDLVETNKKLNYILNSLNVTCDLDLLKDNNMDYFKFENAFRGSRDNVKSIQSQYLSYFTNSMGGDVIDIGSGRGEFLELMKSQGIQAYGIDTYEPFVQYCAELGLTVIKRDALTHIHQLEDNSLGGIFMSQVVEHLSNDYIRALVKTAYNKLKPGCYFILETPNPECLAALTEFNIDMSHIRPVHYKALEYLFKEANYQSVLQYHTEQTMYPVNAHYIEGEGITNINYFNNGIDQINKLMFGYRDYTLIAKK